MRKKKKKGAGSMAMTDLCDIVKLICSQFSNGVEGEMLHYVGGMWRKTLKSMNGCSSKIGK